MTSAQLLAALGNGLFTLAMLVAAIRCLLLWRRTRQVPEFSVGLGFLLIAGVGYPLMAVAGVGSSEVSEVEPSLLGAGLAGIALGVVSLQVFNWKTFRPGNRWAIVLVLSTLLAAIGVCAGAIQALTTAPPDASPVLAARGWWLGLRLLFETWYVWTAIEALGEYGRARRRLALGLSDPVVVNRFLLFGAMGVYLAVNGAIAMVLEYQGMGPLTHLAPALVLMANGSVAAVLILLAFLPPRAYLDFVRGRAAAEPS